jgi:hypothetical protein
MTDLDAIETFSEETPSKLFRLSYLCWLYNRCPILQMNTIRYSYIIRLNFASHARLHVELATSSQLSNEAFVSLTSIPNSAHVEINLCLEPLIEAIPRTDDSGAVVPLPGVAKAEFKVQTYADDLIYLRDAVDAPHTRNYCGLASMSRRFGDDELIYEQIDRNPEAAFFTLSSSRAIAIFWLVLFVLIPIQISI